MKVFREVMSWGIYILAAFGIALVINVFLFQPTMVKGQSMEPTLQDKDRVFLSKLSHTFRTEPDYGDIVVIDSRVERPRSLKDEGMEILKNNLVFSWLAKKDSADEIYWIKRVIGKPGDVLEFKGNQVIRNGIVLEEPYIKEAMRSQAERTVRIPEGYVFVMGDNRNHSNDSRNIGSIPLDHVIGKYVFKF
jgi:signal peptidase I